MENQSSFQTSAAKLSDRILPFVRRAVKAKKVLLRVNAVAFLVTVLIVFVLLKPYFTSTITVLPDYGNESVGNLSQLSGLASLAGINVSSEDPTEIYASLVTSESVLKPVIYRVYLTDKSTDSVNLLQYFEINPDKDLSPELQKRQMFLELYKKMAEKRVKTDVDVTTKILNVSVTMPEAQLSADVANALGESLNAYVLTQRKSFATEQRKYLEQRLHDMKDSLTKYEDNLKQFNEQNRFISQSPALQLQQSRLSRRVDMTTSIFSDLSRQFEIAKLEEVKDTPVINIEEKAENPIKKSGPHRLILLVLLLFFFAGGGSFVVMYIPEIRSTLKIAKKTLAASQDSESTE